MGGHAEDVHAAGGVLDDEERIQPAQCDRVDVEQVASEDRVGLGVQELGPRWSGPSGRGVDAGVVQDWSALKIPDICYGSNYAANCLSRYSLWTSLGVR